MIDPLVKIGLRVSGMEMVVVRQVRAPRGKPRPTTGLGSCVTIVSLILEQLLVAVSMSLVTAWLVSCGTAFCVESWGIRR